MALKKKYGKQADIPEELRPLYKQVGSEFVLDLETPAEDESGDADSTELARRLSEFRTNNRSLAAQLKAKEEALAAQSKRLAALGDAGDDEVSTALKLLSQVQNQADAELIKKGDFDAVITRRMKLREGEWAKKIADAETKAKEALEKHAQTYGVASSVLLEQRFRKALAAKKLRLRPEAEEDAIARAKRDWKTSEALDDNFTPNDGVEAASFEDYVDRLVPQKPHWWDGGGGGGTNPGPGAKVVNGVKVVDTTGMSALEKANALVDVSKGKATLAVQK